MSGGSKLSVAVPTEPTSSSVAIRWSAAIRPPVQSTPLVGSAVLSCAWIPDVVVASVVYVVTATFWEAIACAWHAQ